VYALEPESIANAECDQNTGPYFRVLYPPRHWNSPSRYPIHRPIFTRLSPVTKPSDSPISPEPGTCITQVWGERERVAIKSQPLGVFREAFPSRHAFNVKPKCADATQSIGSFSEFRYSFIVFTLSSTPNPTPNPKYPHANHDSNRCPYPNRCRRIPQYHHPRRGTRHLDRMRAHQSGPFTHRANDHRRRRRHRTRLDRRCCRSQKQPRPDPHRHDRLRWPNTHRPPLQCR